MMNFWLTCLILCLRYAVGQGDTLLPGDVLGRSRTKTVSELEPGHLARAERLFESLELYMTFSLAEIFPLCRAGSSALFASSELALNLEYISDASDQLHTRVCVTDSGQLLFDYRAQPQWLESLTLDEFIAKGLEAAFDELAQPLYGLRAERRLEEIDGCAVSNTDGNCTQCDIYLDFQLVPVDGVCECKVTHYLTGGLCGSCSAAMPGCTECESSSNCTICNEIGGFELVNNECTCNKNNYIDGDNCVLCSEGINGCLECENNQTCTRCDSSASFEINENNTCSCIDGYTFDNATASCELCGHLIPGCLLCEDSEQCLQCDTTLGVDAVPIDGECKCADGQFLNDTLEVAQCDDCVYPCTTCLNETFCITCATPEYNQTANNSTGECECSSIKFYEDFDGDCEACRTECLQCTDNLTCTVCDTNLNFLESPVNGECFCNIGYLREEGPAGYTCTKCSNECSACEGTTTNCTSCNTADGFSDLNDTDSTIDCECSPGEYKTGAIVCEACDAVCATCDGAASNCTSCNTTAGIVDLSTDPGVIECGCPDGQYLLNENSASSCEDCSYVCETCETSVDNCLTCNTTAGFVDLDDSNSTDCGCPEGFFHNTTAQNCESCIEGCVQCSNSTECVVCNEGENYELLNGECVCAETFFFNGTTCEQCDVGCLNCTDASTCLTCNETEHFVLVADDCVCIDGFYFNATLNTCDSCEVGCSNCTSADSCDVCDSADFVLIDGVCQCQLGTFYNGTDCTNCTNPLCDSCENDICQNCTDPNASVVGEECECNAGFYDDGAECKELCELCSDCESPTNCTCAENANFTGTACECDTNYIELLDNTCVGPHPPPDLNLTGDFTQANLACSLTNLTVSIEPLGPYSDENFNYTWSVSGTAATDLVNYVATQNTSSLTVDASLLVQTAVNETLVFEATLTTINGLVYTGNFSVSMFENTEMEVSLLLFEGDAVDSTEITTGIVTKNFTDAFRIEVNYTDICNEPASIVWSFLERQAQGRRLEFINGTEVLSNSNDSSVLIVNPGDLEHGYDYSYLVNVAQGVSVQGNSSIQLSMVASDLVVTLTPELTDLNFSENLTVTIDAFDPNDPDEEFGVFEFVWVCSNSTGHPCLDVDGNELNLTSSDGALFVGAFSLPIGQNFTFTVLATKDTRAESASFSVLISATPLIAVVIPSSLTLANTEELFLDGSDSSDPDDPNDEVAPLGFNWSCVDSNTFEVCTNELTGEPLVTNEFNQNLTIAAFAMAADNNYTFTLEVSKDSRSSQAEAQINVTLSELIAVIDVVNDTISHTESLSLSGANSSDPSNTTDSLVFAWTCLDANGNACLDANGNPLVFDSDNETISFNSFTLAVGTTYMFTLTVSKDPRSASAVTYITVVGSDLVAVIDGGDKSMNNSDLLVLNASSSYDPDDLSSLVGPLAYNWTCDSCVDIEGQPLAFNASAAVLEFDAFTLLPDTTYTFTLTVSKDTRENSTSTTIIVLDQNVVAVIDPVVTLVNNSQPLSLNGSNSFDPDDPNQLIEAMTFEWSCLDSNSSQCLDIVGNVLVSGETNSVLSFNAFTLFPGSVYTFTLTVTKGNDSDTESITITVEDSPLVAIITPNVTSISHVEVLELSGEGSYDIDLPNEQLTYEWSCEYEDSTECTDKDGNALVSGETGVNLTIPAYAMIPFKSHIFILTISNSGGSAGASLEVDVTASDLFINITNSETVVSHLPGLLLTTEASDPDDDNSTFGALSFSWLCVTNEGPCFDIDGNLLVQNESSSTLSIPEVTMVPNSTYEFTVTVAKDVRTANDSFALTVFASNIVAVISGANETISHLDELVLSGLDSYDPDDLNQTYSTFSYRWSCESSLGECVDVFGDPLIANNTRRRLIASGTEVELVIDALSLVINETYTFTLTVTKDVRTDSTSFTVTVVTSNVVAIIEEVDQPVSHLDSLVLNGTESFDPEDPNDLTGDLTYEWSCVMPVDQQCVDLGGAPLTFTNDEATVTIPELTLILGETYIFTLNVTKGVRWDTESIEILVDEGSLVALIDPSNTTVSYALDFSVNGDDSYDPLDPNDQKGSLEYSWSCVTESGAVCVDVYGVEVVKDPSNDDIDIDGFALEPDVDYIFTLTVSKDVRNATAVSVITPIISDLVAVIDPLNVTVLHTEELLISGEDSYDPDDPNSQHGSLAYSWTCENAGQPCLDKNGDLLAEVLNTSTISIEAYALVPYSTYTFTLTVSKDTRNATATTWIEVLASDLVAVIHGANRTVNYGDTVIVDGRDSFDPDDPLNTFAPLLFNWSCVNATGDACLDTDGQLLVPDPTVEELIFPPLTLNPSEEYSFTLQVSKDSRSDTDFAVLAVVSTDLVAIIDEVDSPVPAETDLTLNGANSFDPDDPFSLSGSLAYSWSCQDLDGEPCLDLFGNPLVEDETEPTLELSGDLLVPGAEYNFTLVVSKDVRTASDHESVAVENTGLVAIIDKEDSEVVNTDELILSGSASFDPDDPEGLLGDLDFDWTCEHPNGDECLNLDGDVLFVDEIGENVTIPELTLVPGQVYIITLTVSKDTREATDTVTLTVRYALVAIIDKEDGTVPFSEELVLSGEDSFDPDDPFDLVEEMTYSWSCEDSEGNECLDANGNPIFGNETEVTLTLPAFALIPGEVYVITLTVFKDVRSATDTVTLTVSADCTPTKDMHVVDPTKEYKLCVTSYGCFLSIDWEQFLGPDLKTRSRALYPKYPRFFVPRKYEESLTIAPYKMVPGQCYGVRADYRTTVESTEREFLWYANKAPQCEELKIEHYSGYYFKVQLVNCVDGDDLHYPLTYYLDVTYSGRCSTILKCSTLDYIITPLEYGPNKFVAKVCDSHDSCTEIVKDFNCRRKLTEDQPQLDIVYDETGQALVRDERGYTIPLVDRDLTQEAAFSVWYILGASGLAATALAAVLAFFCRKSRTPQLSS